jgi:hypothetical protein
VVQTSTIISIASAVLGSTLILSGITTLFSEFINAPKIIQSEPIEISNTNGISVGLTNEGRAAAKNLYVTVVSNRDVNYTIFSTENKTILTNDHRTLIAYFPRFIHGEGSVIKIDITPAKNTGTVHLSSQNYSINAVYDQGSIILPNQEEASTIPIGMTVLFTIAGVIAFCIPYFYTRGKRYRQYRAADLIKEIISYYKEHYESDHGKSDSSISQETITLSKSIDNFKDLFRHDKGHEHDFSKINHFCYILARRNIELQEAKKELEKVKTSGPPTFSENPTLTEKAKKVNASVVEAAKKVENLKWEDYGVNEIRILERISDKKYYSPLRTIRFLLLYYPGISIGLTIVRPVASILVIPVVLILGSWWTSRDPFIWIQKFQVFEIELILIGGILAVLAYRIIGSLFHYLRFGAQFPIAISYRPNRNSPILLTGLVASIIINIILILLFFRVIG